MKATIASLLAKSTKLKKDDIENLIEVPKDSKLGDFAFPCFSLSKEMKKSPVEIAKDLVFKLKSPELEKVEAIGPYLNFFVNKSSLATETLGKIQREKEKFGSSKKGKGKRVVIDMSSPNIAKPFGIGHLRSTIIGNSLSEIAKFQGYDVTKINYLGDWGTQFGKMIVGWKKKGNEIKLKKEPIKHLLELYVEGNKTEYEDDARKWFKKLEDGDKEALQLWNKFKEYSLKEFDIIYNFMGIKFDVLSGESKYNDKMEDTIKLLAEKGLLEESEGAQIVNLEEYKLGVCLIKKSDGATLYATRDITAAIERQNDYKFSKMIYEVGNEQRLHFQQLFKVLELLGFQWAKDCVHVNHGLYLDEDGKKFATRKGKTIFMEDILSETVALAKEEIKKREKLDEKELEERAKKIALAAIFYGDLKNYRANDIIFDVNKFISFEGNTGPYLLYSYARAKSILRKANFKETNIEVKDLSESEKALINKLASFPEVVQHSFDNLSPNIIANYSFDLSQLFNEFYHSSQVIGSEQEALRLSIVNCFAQTLSNALSLLGISVIEKM
ncbi:MAG: arginyl-tRNA ligase [Candidatus Nomurabacteria bacterium GW2011_GWC2_35_8]|uniref:Arginine--tRNA ligase n=1 Tax=Candidatus Nomurabacteria bacterium GW2011_GWC2_35_8 TaxID=1618752 RepID=A0A0G0DHL3_9BACT|nr:MAG: arginyl-tRNA ligase [Candidatus Nomurabacteria bacterium GW2011_GWC2_35_8]